HPHHPYTYPPPLHDALPIFQTEVNAIFRANGDADPEVGLKAMADLTAKYPWAKNIPYFQIPKLTKLAQTKKTDEACQLAKGMLRSEEHTSELQSPDQLVCRL